MNKHMENSWIFHKRELNTLNEAVLTIIRQKKYPLNYHFNSSLTNNHYHLHKLSTSPSEPITKHCTQLPLGLTNRLQPHKLKKNNIRQRSMGEHLLTLRGKQISLPFSSSQCFQEVNQKINSYLWSKKRQDGLLTQEVTNSTNSMFKNQQVNSKTQQNSQSLQNLPKLLKNFRKSLLIQAVNQTEPNQIDHPTTLDIKQHLSQLKSIDFYQGHKERNNLSKKYPVKAAKASEDLDKQMLADLVCELKQNKYLEKEGKYSKMRIMANHRKIISMG